MYYNSTNIGYNETASIYKCGGNTYANKSEKEMEVICSKIRKSKIGKNNPHSTMIKCLNVETLDEFIFESAEQCRLYFGENTHRFITTRVTHQTRSLYKGVWAISYFNEDYAYEYNVKKSGLKVCVLNWRTFESFEFNSIRSLCEEMKIDRSLISNRTSNQFFIGDYRITILD